MKYLLSLISKIRKRHLNPLVVYQWLRRNPEDASKIFTGSLMAPFLVLIVLGALCSLYLAGSLVYSLGLGWCTILVIVTLALLAKLSSYGSDT